MKKQEMVNFINRNKEAAILKGFDWPTEYFDKELIAEEISEEDAEYFFNYIKSIL